MRSLALAGLSAALLLGFAWIAGAAGVERTLPSTTRILFEEGSYAEIGLTYSDPHQQGSTATLPPVFTPFPGPGPIRVEGKTPDLFKPHLALSGAFRTDITPRLSMALLAHQPYGAETSYGPDGFAGGFFTYEGTIAELESRQVIGLLAYDLRPDLKVYGGLRALWTKANADVPFLLDYTVRTKADWGTGHLVGLAYSRPEIALRVALTYASEIEIRYETEEWDSFESTTAVTFPRSVEFEFQTGIAPGTLVFGSARWVDWSAFEIAPERYSLSFGEPLVRYDADYTTYTLGLGRQLTDRLSGSISLLHEPARHASQLNTLGPYDGRTVGAVALSYDLERINVSGGVVYGALGKTRNGFRTDFDNGSVWGAGLRLGYSF
jgi:long-chain fatty acid transport protein